ncbi:MAG: hypothetical protein MSL26_04625 [Clostridiales bacterium]|nr:hypothetical protein [Clostridiales bacterium]
MKCKQTEKKSMTVMLIVGMILLIGGFGAARLLPEEQHLATRLAGFVSGIGGAFAAIGAVVLIRRAVIGEERAKDSELSMKDERGQMIAYRAQCLLAIAAVLSLCVIVFVSLMRGDTFMMLLAAALCLVSAAVKVGALWFYGKRM